MKYHIYFSLRLQRSADRRLRCNDLQYAHNSGSKGRSGTAVEVIHDPGICFDYVEIAVIGLGCGGLCGSSPAVIRLTVYRRY